MTLLYFNSCKMYKYNNRRFMEDLAPETNKFTSKSAHIIYGSQLEKQNLVIQGKADQNIGNASKAQRIAKCAKKEAAKKALDKIFQELVHNTDIINLKKAPGTIPAIELQLEQHRTFDPDVPKKSTLNNKTLKLETLTSAIEHLNSGKVVKPTSQIIGSPEDEAMDGDNMDTEEEMDDEGMMDY